MNKSIIALAVAGVLASGAVNAADGDINSADNTVPLFSVATLSLDAVVRGVAAGAQSITLTPENSALPILATGDKLSLELTGGATFDTASLALELAHVDFVYDDSTDAGVLDDNTVSIDASSCTLSMGDAKVVCDLTVADTSNISASFTLENTKYNLSAVPSTETEVSLIAKVISTDVFGNVVEKYSPPTGGASDVFTVSAGIVKPGALTADTTAVAQVSESFFKFASAAVTTPNNATTDAKIAVLSADVTLETADFADATGKYLIKLSNLPTGTKKVTVSEVAGTGITASNATGGAETATESGTFFLDGSGNGYAVSALDANVGYEDLIIEVTGTDPISAGDAKIEIVYLAGAGDAFVDHTILEEATFVTIERNGTSFTTNSVGPALKIKITDMSGSLVPGTGGISLIAYDAAGAMISGTMTIPDLESNSMVKITGTDLAAAYPGVKRVDVSVASSDITAAAQKVNADGGINVNTLHINSTSGAANSNGAI